jgi:hypothetical protein
MEIIIQTCKTCDHFNYDGQRKDYGECRRYPPVSFHSSEVATFPLVEASMDCGEYEPIAEGKSDAAPAR